MGSQLEAAPLLEQADPALEAELAEAAEDLAVEKPEILMELIIEEVSIDGMCGVY